jgi:hypothetical protein
VHIVIPITNLLKKEEWIIARYFTEFINIINLKGLPEIVSLIMI